MSLLFKNYLHVEVMYLLITCNENKLFPWNTKNTDGNGVYKQNIQMHTKHSKITLEIVSMKISDTLFSKTTQPRLPHFATPPFLWEKSVPLLFCENFENSNLPSLQGREDPN